MLVKLTDRDGQTWGGMQWGPGVTHEVMGTEAGTGVLCSPYWLHLYEGLGVALLHNPLGANFSTPRAWRAVARVERREGLKAGVQRLTTVEEVTYVTPTVEQLVTVALLLAFDCYDPASDTGAWGAWAVNWLSGEDRTAAAARAAAARAARAAAEASTRAGEKTYARHVNAVACAVFGY